MSIENEDGNTPLYNAVRASYPIHVLAYLVQIDFAHGGAKSLLQQGNKHLDNPSSQSARVADTLDILFCQGLVRAITGTMFQLDLLYMIFATSAALKSLDDVTKILPPSIRTAILGHHRDSSGLLDLPNRTEQPLQYHIKRDVSNPQEIGLPGFLKACVICTSIFSSQRRALALVKVALQSCTDQIFDNTSQLPLHSALEFQTCACNDVVKVPAKVLHLLIEHYLESAVMPDPKNGRLPVHIALLIPLTRPQQNSLAVANLPDSKFETNNEDLLIFDLYKANPTSADDLLSSPLLNVNANCSETKL